LADDCHHYIVLRIAVRAILDRYFFSVLLGTTASWLKYIIKSAILNSCGLAEVGLQGPAVGADEVVVVAGGAELAVGGAGEKVT
jgi:hypothetical protein